MRPRPASPTLNAALERAATVPGAGLELVDRRERSRPLPWAEVHRQASEVAAGLVARGVRPGDRVALIYPTGEEFFAAFFGALLAGAVPAPLYPPVRLGRLSEYHAATAAMVEAAGARMVLADRRVARLLGETVARARPELGALRISELPAGQPVARAVSEDDLALVQFSSGTTVAPKPVALSHRAVMAQVGLLNGFWPDSEEIEHSGVSWLPLYHDMGLIGCVFAALERPARLALIPPELFVARPAVWLRALSRTRATVSPAPSFAYGLCVEKVRDEELDGVDLSAWRVALNGAEAVAPSVLAAFTERFARWGFRPEAMTPVYGMSEASLAVTFSDLRTAPSVRRFERDELAREQRAVEADDGLAIVSVGRPLPGFEIEVRGPRAERLDDGRVGRVWTRGPSLMAGYLGRPEATARALVDGWLDTGDLGFVHRGELFLTGRAKDLLIVRGRNHAPEEVERAVDGLEAVRTGCAVAVSWLPEGAPSERVVLFVERAKGISDEAALAAVDEAKEAVLAATGIHLDEVRVLPPGTLPRTSSGKLRRAEALARHRAGTLAPPEKVTPLRLVGAMLRSRRAFATSRRPPER